MDLSPRLAGAVPLDRLAGRTPSAPARPENGSAADSVIIDVTEAGFQTDVIERSMSVPVVIDFWAAWCQPCKQLSPVLERLAAADAGRWVLAKIDVDANQRLAAAAGVQGIPAVKAVWRGQVIGEFSGAIPETEARRWLDELLRLTGGEAAPGSEGAEPAGPADDPGVIAAREALAAGDVDGAAQALRAVLEERPGDDVASRELAKVELYRRGAALDPAVVLAAASQRPDDVEAQCAAADVELLTGDPDAALGRLLDAVRRYSGADRERARTHLLSLFEALGPADPKVAKARTALANALF